MLDFQNTFGSENLDAEPGGPSHASPVGGKEPVDAILEGIHGINAVTGQRADSFFPFVHIGFRDRFSFESDLCKTVFDIPGKGSHQIEHVSAEHPEVFTAASTVLFTPCTDLKNVADDSVTDDFVDNLSSWR